MTEHNHLPNPVDVEIRDVKQTMRHHAQFDLTPLKEIVEQELRQALLTAEALALLPNVEDISMFIYLFIEYSGIYCCFFIRFIFLRSLIEKFS